MFVTTHIDSDAKSRKSLEGIAVINDFTLDKNKFNALIDYTKHAVMRMLPNPIKQYESNGIKFLEIFENYRVECNKNDVLNFSIKTEMNPDAEFKSYAYHYKPVSHTMAMQESHLGIFMGESRWIFDLSVDSSDYSLRAFLHKEKANITYLSYREVAVIIKMAEYLGLLEFVDNSLLFLIAREKRDYYWESYLIEELIEDLSFKKEFSKLFSKVFSKLDDEQDYLDFQLDESINNTLKKCLKGMSSAKVRQIFDLLTQRDEGGRKSHRTMRISRLIYVSQRFAPYMIDIKRVEKYSKAQLFYLLTFEKDITQFSNLDYFSYDNILGKEGSIESFKFPSKKAFRNFCALDLDFLSLLFHGVCKPGLLEPNFLITAQEFNRGRYSRSCSDNELSNKTPWEVLMIWLEHGEQCVGLKRSKANEYKLDFIRFLISMLSYRLNVGEESLALKYAISRKKLALMLDFCVIYFDEITREYNNVYQDLAREKKEFKATRWSEFEDYALAHNNLEHKRFDTLGSLYNTMMQRIDSLRDFIEHYDDKWGNFPNLECIDRTTTIKSFERKIERWHKDLNGFSEEELESAKQVRYNNLKSDLIQFNDAEFMPIWNLYELMLEGAEMRHCVAAFNYHILNGVYIVFKVLYEEERATLGLTLKQTHKGQEWALAQCYGKYNQIPSDALLRKAVEFVKMINLNTSTIFKD